MIPKENEKDLVDMPKKIIDEVKITPVEYADEVLKIALTKELKRQSGLRLIFLKKMTNLKQAFSKQKLLWNLF